MPQSAREYASPLRAEQASRTRALILEAFAEQLADEGLKDFSIERVAKRAGVSTRTVYHHFPTREALLDAVSLWMDETFASQGIGESMTLDQFLERVRTVFASFDEHESFIRAQLLTSLGRTLRDRSRSQRRQMIEEIVRKSAPDAAAKDVHRVASLVHYLTNSEAWRSMKDESGMDGTESGEAVTWAIKKTLDELKRPGAGPSRETE